jgi:hypothetical protein
MQVIYALPFVLLSMLGFLMCVAVPRWRRYRLQALVAPVAFGFCSIVPMGAIVLTSDHFNLGLFSKPRSGLRDAVPLLSIYFIPGLVGSWCAVATVTKIVRRLNS